MPLRAGARDHQGMLLPPLAAWRGRQDAIIFGYLVGKLDVLVVECPKGDRRGRYSLGRLIARHGRDAKLIEWKDELTADCPLRATVGRPMTGRQPKRVVGNSEVFGSAN
jgi:hypothetical protein